MTDYEIRELVMSEYAYWREASEKENADEAASNIALGAMGATSNLIVALFGHRASWHPKPQPLKYLWLRVQMFLFLEMGFVIGIAWLVSRLIGAQPAPSIVGAVLVRGLIFLAELRVKGVI